MPIKSGSTVTLDYKVYVDGQLVDETNPDQPLVYVQGEGQIIPGLEKNLEGLNAGDTKEVVVEPEEAYGEYSEERFMHVPREDLPTDVEPEAGMQLQAMSDNGSMFVGVITDIKPDHVDVDFNHPLAGKTLRFEIQVKTSRARNNKNWQGKIKTGVGYTLCVLRHRFPGCFRIYYFMPD